MNWQIKTIENKGEFNELEQFYKDKFPNIFHNKLSSNYLFWKLKKNTCFFGEILIAKYNDKIVGSTSLTFKTAKFNSKKTLVAEIGDCYVDIGIQKKIIKDNIELRNSTFLKKSIFGSLVKKILEYSENKKIYLTYGTPNNKSFQGFTKFLNFNSFEKLKINSYILPSIKSSATNSKYIRLLTCKILKFYRILMCRIFYNNLKLIEDDFLSSDEIMNLSDDGNNNYKLDKTKLYFIEKYKNNPENNYKFFKIYKNNILLGLYVLKEDKLKEKVLIVDNLSKRRLNFFVALKINIKYNFSVSFWDDSNVLNNLKQIILTTIKTRKINVIYYNHIKFNKRNFFDELNLGESDNF